MYNVHILIIKKAPWDCVVRSWRSGFCKNVQLSAIANVLTAVLPNYRSTKGSHFVGILFY